MARNDAHPSAGETFRQARLHNLRLQPFAVLGVRAENIRPCSRPNRLPTRRSNRNPARAEAQRRLVAKALLGAGLPADDAHFG